MVIKMPVSDDFKKFATKNRKVVAEARQAENQSTGCPLPIGTEGVAVVGEVNFTTTKKKPDGTGGEPMLRVTLEVETPEEYRGKKLSGPGLMQMIRETQKQTAAEAFGRALDLLEGLGLPEELRRDEDVDIEEIVGWFEDEPRRVNYSVRKDDFAGNRSGKTVNASEMVDMDSAPSADDPEENDEEGEVEDDPDAEYVSYFNKKNKVLERDGDVLTLQVVDSGRIRKGVPEAKVEPWTGK